MVEAEAAIILMMGEPIVPKSKQGGGESPNETIGTTSNI